MATSKKHFIQAAIKRPGALHEHLGIAPDKKIPLKTLQKAAKEPGVVGQEARFAQTLRGMHRPHSTDGLRKIYKKKFGDK